MDAAGQLAVKPILSAKTKVVVAGLDHMSNIAPFKCKHFVWKCLIDGPLLEFPLTISSLVDKSCHLVLIRPDIVEKLGLNVFSLKTPELIDVAIKDCKRKKKLELKKYVILSTGHQNVFEPSLHTIYACL